MSSLYGQNLTYSPARAPSSPHIWANPDVESSYLAELLEEKLKLAPFMRILPFCTKLLNQEIFRASTAIPNQGFNDFDRMQRGSPSPLHPLDVISDIDANGLIRWNGNAGWSPLQHEVLYYLYMSMTRGGNLNRFTYEWVDLCSVLASVYI
ncbi:putative STAR protein, homodimerization region [Helianthus annuus]|nr:putative STAR protein, homodimerization region [Helianthus annuus]